MLKMLIAFLLFLLGLCFLDAVLRNNNVSTTKKTGDL